MRNQLVKSLFTTLIIIFYSLINVANAGLITLNHDTEVGTLLLSSSFTGFYSYGTPNAASANTGLEEEGNAIMFLAEHGGELSFFTLLDAPGATHSTRSLNMTLSDFTLSDVLLVDDPQEGTSSGFSWRWVSCCTDGMIYKISDKDTFDINITFSDVVGVNDFKFLSFNDQMSSPEVIMVGTSFSIQAVPEPTILGIYALGLIGLGLRRFAKHTGLRV